MSQSLIVAFVALALATSGCRAKSDDSPDLTPEEAKRLLAKIDEEKKKAEVVPQPAKRPPAGAASSKLAPAGSVAPVLVPETATPSPATSAAPDRPTPVGPWILDEPVPIAPAGPATATRRGAVLYNRADAVYVARLGRLSRNPKSKPTPITKTPKSAGRFPLTRGPAVFRDYVYWVSGSNLVRRHLDPKDKPGPIEVLATDAYDGTRVAAPIPTPHATLAEIPAAVAYIVKPKKSEDPLLAKLWTEGGEFRLLTPEGSSTHSVALLHTAGGLTSLALQARTAMTPVHARRIRFAKSVPLLDEDVVVWVGGGVKSLTELTVLANDKAQLWGFLPHEKSMTEFGLAKLEIGAQPDMNTPTSWTFYPNGIDPAPVGATHLCGEPVVAYARPAHSEPDAPQQLMVRTVDGRKAQIVGKAEAYFDLSIAEVEGGALLTYVADWVTWARTLRCKAPPR